MAEKALIEHIAHSVRKDEHLRINLEEDVQYKTVSAGFDAYRFVHQALPELDAAAIDTSTHLFGKRLALPLVISPMTGGVPAATRINRHLALAAQTMKVGLSIGSQRPAIESRSGADSYRVRDVAPDVLLFANLGAVQLNYGFALDECQRAVDMIEADALTLHLNPLQEALQPEGNTNFSGLLRKIESICRSLHVPVLVKEVGFGISEEVGRMLVSAGVAGIDVAGAGGTSWTEVERHRCATQLARNVAATFAGWGIPTAESLRMVRRATATLPVVASGGIRNGLHVAVAIALGADATGMAAPMLSAAAVSAQAVTNVVKQLAAELRVAMFCTGAGSIEALRHCQLMRHKEG